MGIQSINKDTFIKFNVSPKFKKLAQKRADEIGFSLSDLGRLLFGAYIHGDIFTSPDPLSKTVSEAKYEYSRGQTASVKNTNQLKTHLNNLKKAN